MDGLKAEWQRSLLLADENAALSFHFSLLVFASNGSEFALEVLLDAGIAFGLPARIQVLSAARHRTAVSFSSGEGVGHEWNSRWASDVRGSV